MKLMQKIDNLQDVFVYELSDMYNAEKQLVGALPKMAKAATDPKLQKAFEDHLRETEIQVVRIEKAAEASNLELRREKCEALEGLIAEGREVIDHVASGPLLDAALIMAAQKVEHYEISGYGSLCELATQLGFSEAARLLGETLDEEKGADETLSALAKNGINQQAQAFAV